VTRSPPSLATSAARGSLITLVGQSVRIVTQFASISVLARLLGSVDYGYLAMVLAVIGIAELFRDFGLSAAAIQSRDLSHAQQSNLFWLNSLIGAAASVVVFAASPLVALIYGEPALATITRALSPIFLLNGMATQFRASINRSMRFVALSVTDVVPQLIAFAVAVPLAISVRNYWALVAQQVTVSAVGLAMTVAMARWRPSLPSREAKLGTQIRFGTSLFTTNLMTYGVNNSQTVMIGAAWGPVVVGFFSRAYQLMALPLTQIVAPLTKVALPILSRVYDEPRRYANIVGRAQLLGLYLTAPLFILCFSLAGPLIRLALGPQWVESVPVFAILALGGAFRAMSQLAFWIFLSSGSTRQQMKFNAVAYPALVGLMLAGLPWQGVGVSVGHTLGYALYWPLSLFAACRAAKIGFRALARTAARVSTIVGIGVLLISSVIARLGWPDLVTVVVASLASLCYLGLTMIILPAGRADFHTLSSFVRGLRR
jgi:O-antigen/teichoic acid export membrane protein